MKILFMFFFKIVGFEEMNWGMFSNLFRNSPKWIIRCNIFVYEDIFTFFLIVGIDELD